MMTDAKIMTSLIADVRAGYSLPQDFYTSDAVFKADMDQVISRKWLLAGHVSRIPNKGDYFLFRVGGEQIIVSRECPRFLQRLPPPGFNHLSGRKRKCTAPCLPLSCLDLRAGRAADLRAADAR
jgi:hypothetical protein